MKYYYTYMVLCSDGMFYTGISNDPIRREAEHNEGKNPKAWTYSRRPVHLVYTQEFQWVQEAIEWETRLKKWSSAKKRALVNGDYDAIHELAKCVNETRSDRPRDEQAEHDIEE
jgi:putative endonuclease